MSDDRPIGIFDSGVGGLTVARALQQRLPHESLIYYGDTARLPYGNKTPQVVTAYSLENSAFLIERGAKVIIVACHTASAVALEALREQLAVPVIGVVAPGAEVAAGATRNGRIALLATRGTVASRAYDRAIAALDPTFRLLPQPCPLFVPLVEEGLYHHACTRLFASEYLAPVLDFAADTLLLGCTHYPYLVPLIQEIVGETVTLVDVAAATAALTATLLKEEGIESTQSVGHYKEFFSGGSGGRSLDHSVMRSTPR